MYITLAKIKENLCTERTKDFEKVCEMVSNTEDRLTLKQVLKILGSGIPADGLVYQIRSFRGENALQFYVEFAIRSARTILPLAETPAAKRAIKAAERWLEVASEENATNAAAYAAAFAAFYASAFASDADADAAGDASSYASPSAAVVKDLRELITKYYDKELKE